MRRAAALALCAASAALAAAPAPAGADVFGPISLVSAGVVPGGGAPQQADYAHDPAVSADGRYVAFDGAFAGVAGIWRRDLLTGTVEEVAGGDAELPSISEDGRYVSFTTNEGATLPEITDGLPDEHPRQEAVNVYVRDMSLPVPASGHCEPPAGRCPFTVASAPNGSAEPLAYAAAGVSLGSAAVGRSAISADGNEVAFVTTAVSDLADPSTPTEPNTPALQVAVRYMDTHETKLVGTDRETGGPVSGTEGSETLGAAYAGRVRTFIPPPAYGDWGNRFPPGASISADGSTVAWMGQNIDRQAPMLSGETRNPRYTEPLWRRIAPGSETPVERVTGGSDPADPACAASGEAVLPPSPSASDPCQGPFNLSEEQASVSGIWNSAGESGDFVPRLSADGWTVAFLSDAPLITAGENFGLFAQGQPSDLYVADMHPGLTREEALTRLTELAGGEGNIAADEPIYDFAVSPDGAQIAFVTRRTRFPLGLPAYVSPQAGESGLNELFDVNLADGTLTRVTHGFRAPEEAAEHAHRPVSSVGEDPYEHRGDGALSPSFSAGGLLAFSSTASNLVYGDGNSPPSGALDGSDVFLAERITFSAVPVAQYISPAPPGPVFAPEPRGPAPGAGGALPGGHHRPHHRRHRRGGRLSRRSRLRRTGIRRTARNRSGVQR
jgi:WD40-like Beta Propeller Repeat